MNAENSTSLSLCVAMARPSQGGGGWVCTISPLDTAVAGFPVYAGWGKGLTSWDVPGCKPGCQNC
jgi:hypothetical protein